MLGPWAAGTEGARANPGSAWGQDRPRAWPGRGVKSLRHMTRPALHSWRSPTHVPVVVGGSESQLSLARKARTRRPHAGLPLPAPLPTLPPALHTFLEHIGRPHPHGARARRAAGQFGVALVVVDGAAGPGHVAQVGLIVRLCGQRGDRAGPGQPAPPKGTEACTRRGSPVWAHPRDVRRAAGQALNSPPALSAK